MRTAAEIHVVALTVQRNRFTGRNGFNDLGFVVFADRLEELDRFITVHFFTLDLQIALDDLIHFLFDFGQIFKRQRMRHREVIIETVFNNRSDCDLSVREQFLDCLRHQMGGRVTDNLKAFRILVRDDSYCAVFSNRSRKIDQFSIYLSGEGCTGKPGAN